MKSAYIYKSSLVIKIALAVSIILIIYLSTAFYSQMQRLEQSVESISNSNKRRTELDKIISAILINELAVRSFIITRDSIYLQKKFSSKFSLSPAFETLRLLARNSPTNNFSHDTLQSLVDRRFLLFRKVIYAADSNNVFNPNRLREILADSDDATVQIREYIYQLKDNESSNVTLYEINHKYEIETSIITSFLLVTMTLFILIVSLYRINYDLENLKKLNDEMKFLNYTFNNAEKIAGISHWKYNLKTHKYTFSDNFYDYFDLNPELAETDFENVLPALHPEDRQAVIDSYIDSFRNKTPTSMIYRLCRKNGDLRYIKSVGSFAENSDGQAVKIAVNYDITEQYINMVNLEEKNRHLIAVNAELESFNNIVSHDLQEPLRKIQMFISRISENELAALSENGKDYFTRIGVSANRMQRLLIDLVNYSLTVNSDKTFAMVSLNDILADVTTELFTDIQEKGAIIFIENFPEIKGIPFQLRQLFINLITNALKFRREDTVPEIRITLENIDDNEVKDNSNISETAYLKIVISDNGIGFRQEFADKIFLLFRQLEKTTFQGTGIGLAICKKIVDNHDGYIIAEGVPNVGARFVIYLPK